MGVFKSTFEDWGPLLQMSGSTASAINLRRTFENFTGLLTDVTIFQEL